MLKISQFGGLALFWKPTLWKYFDFSRGKNNFDQNWSLWFQKLKFYFQIHLVPALQCPSLELVWKSLKNILFCFQLYFFWPDKRAPLFTISQILFIFVNEPRIVLTAYQDDRSLGAEPPDLMVPHRPQQILMIFFLRHFSYFCVYLQCSKLTIRPMSKHIRTTSALP